MTKYTEQSNTILGALKRLIVNISKTSTGAKAEVVADTNAHTGDYFAIQVVSNAVIAAILTGASGGQAIVGVTLQPGVYWIPCSSITLTSGTIILYSN